MHTWEWSMRSFIIIIKYESQFVSKGILNSARKGIMCLNMNFLHTVNMDVVFVTTLKYWNNLWHVHLHMDIST